MANYVNNYSKSSQNHEQKFTTELLGKFIASRPQGASKRSIESYHYTLDGFVGYPVILHKASMPTLATYLVAMARLNSTHASEHYPDGCIAMIT